MAKREFLISQFVRDSLTGEVGWVYEVNTFNLQTWYRVVVDNYDMGALIFIRQERHLAPVKIAGENVYGTFNQRLLSDGTVISFDSAKGETSIR